MDQENTAASTINRLESRLGQLHKDALLNSQRDRLGEIDAQLVRLPQQVTQLRSRGYVYKTHLEEQLGQLAQRWPIIRAQAASALDTQVALLRAEIDRADDAVRRLQPLKTRPLSTAQPTIRSVDDGLSAAERRIRAAQQSVESMFAAVAAQVQSVAQEVAGCERMFDWLAGATFVIEPGEGPVAATEARWVDGKNETPGILFLTDRRMIFERREKVALKKVLFVTTSSEMVRELRWQVALADMERIDASEARRALAAKREMLTVVARSGSGAEFHLGMDSDTWRALALRCQSGEMAAERAGGAPEVPEYIVPAKCVSCGGSLRQAGRVRAVSAISCDYCGAGITLERA
jgi:hypothetical protein